MRRSYSDLNASFPAQSDDTFEVKLASPAVWGPLVEGVFGSLPAPARRLALAILTTLHDRHVGITPPIAAELAPLLLDPAARPKPQGVWAATIGRLAAELAPPDRARIGAQATSSPAFGLLLGARPLYVVLRLALPLVEVACRRLGRCYLFCADEVPRSVATDDYAAYVRDLAGAIVALAQEQNEPVKLLWQDWALTLSSLTRSGDLTHFSGSAVPQTDLPALGMLLRLDPNLDSNAAHAPKVRNLARQRQVYNRQLKEGGIDGIRLTRDVDEIDTILLSEFLNPPLILGDRLANSGYLAIRREPKPVKLRDVLVAALAPGETRALASADLVKACWFDLMARLSLILRQNDLHQSEFRWIEGDAFGRERHQALLLRAIPQFETAPERNFSRNYRQQFLTALRWLPSYLDTRAEFDPLPESTAPGNGLTGMQSWLAQAWLHQPDNDGWRDLAYEVASRRDQAPGQARRQRDEGRLDVRQFAYVHLMVFLSTQWQNDSKAANLLATLYGSLRLGQHPGAHISLTWLPDRSDDLAGWWFRARQQPTTALFSQGEEASLSEIAGRLAETWLEQLTKEMWRG